MLMVVNDELVDKAVKTPSSGPIKPANPVTE
jgi:hypothetical protein